jgi:hypothetical protein
MLAFSGLTTLHEKRVSEKAASSTIMQEGRFLVGKLGGFQWGRFPISP